MSQLLKIAVIGVGSLGQHHARNYEWMEDVELVAIVDKNLEQAKKVVDRIKAAAEEKNKKKNWIKNIFFKDKSRDVARGCRQSLFRSEKQDFCFLQREKNEHNEKNYESFERCSQGQKACFVIEKGDLTTSSNTWHKNVVVYKDAFMSENITYREFCKLEVLHWKGLEVNKIYDIFQAVKAIRSGEAGITNLRIPIIALTADAFPETKQRVLDWGMNDLVSKPFKKTILNDRIFQMARSYCPEKLTHIGDI